MELPQIMQLVVCSTVQKECMLMKCLRCPGKDGAKVILLNHLYEQLDLDEDNDINHRQWTYTDRTALVTCQMTVSQFVDDLAEKADQLTIHHYIAKSQAS